MEFEPTPVLRDKTFTFQMFWNARHCLRRFIKEYLKHEGEVPKPKKLAALIGKIFESVRACETKDEGLEIIANGVRGLSEADKNFVLQRLMRLIIRAGELTEIERTGKKHEKVERKKMPQFYANLPNGWRLPAKPDDIEFVRDDSGKCILIRVGDDKTGGQISPKITKNLVWHGLVVSLWDQQQKREEAAKLEAETAANPAPVAPKAKRSKRRRRKLYRARPAAPKPQVTPIELNARMMGLKRLPSGELVDAPQPGAVRYSHSLEPSYVQEISGVISRVERAFENNEFPATKCTECRDCPFARNCEGFAQWEKDNAEQHWGRKRSRGKVRSPYNYRRNKRYRGSSQGNDYAAAVETSATNNAAA